MTSRAQVFKALQHDVRQEILRRLENGNPVLYSDLLDLTESSTGKLNYHLRVLGNLVKKTDDGYVITEQGSRILKWLNNFLGEEDFSEEKPEIIIEPFYPMRELKKKFIIIFMIFYLPVLTSILIFARPAILYLIFIGLLVIIFIIAYCNRIVYLMDEAEIIVKKGIITKTEKIVPYRTITNLELTSGPLDRLWNMSTIKVHTAGMNTISGAEEKLIGLADGEDIRDTILERIALLNPPRFSEDAAFQQILLSLQEINEELK